VLAARLPERFGYGTVLVSAAVVGDGVMLFVPALHGPPEVIIPALVAINFVFGTFGQLVNVTVMVIRQAITPPGMQGRAAATVAHQPSGDGGRHVAVSGLDGAVAACSAGAGGSGGTVSR